MPVLYDLIIRRKREKIVFESLTPKGEEFLQLYLTTNTVDIGTSLALKYKWEAEKLGLQVEFIL